MSATSSSRRRSSTGRVGGRGRRDVGRNLPARRSLTALSIRSVAATALLGGVALAAPAAAAVAPGRVTFPTAPTAEHVGNTSLELSAGVALPSGGVVLAGRDGGAPSCWRSCALTARSTPPSAPRGSRRGTADVGAEHARPQPPGPARARRAAARRGDGNPLRRERERSAGRRGRERHGTLDASFGSGGVAAPGVQSSCLQCSPAALAPDGSIVLTGNTGQIPPGIAQHPGVVVDFHWVVARLTPTGRLDPRFGAQGIAKLPGTSGAGYGSVSLPGGDVAVLGADLAGPKLARLTPVGALDPFFNHGEPVGLSRAVLFWFGLRGRADGSVDALGSGPQDRAPRGTPHGHPRSRLRHRWRRESRHDAHARRRPRPTASRTARRRHRVGPFAAASTPAPRLRACARVDGDGHRRLRGGRAARCVFVAGGTSG